MKKLLFFIIGLIAYTTLFAQYNDYNKHIVISIIPSSYHCQSSTTILDSIYHTINTIDPIGKADVFSLVNCSFAKNRKLEVKVDVHNCLPYKMKYITHQTFRSRSHQSILSVAKPFSLQALKSDTPISNRLFLVLVTDRSYAGNDFFEEMQNAAKHQNTKIENIREILDVCDKMQQNFFCNLIKIQLLRDGWDKIYVHYYEYIPIQQYFSTASILSYSTQTIATRKKDGYTINVKIDEKNHPNFDPLLLKSYLMQSDGVNQIAIDSAQVKYKNGTASLDFFLDNINRKNNSRYTIHFKNWIQFKDGIINSLILTPNGSELQGRMGLNNYIEVTFKESAQILWLFDIPEGLYKATFWIDDQNKAATFWTILIFIVIIATIIAIVLRLRKDTSPEVKIKL